MNSETNQPMTLPLSEGRRLLEQATPIDQHARLTRYERDMLDPRTNPGIKFNVARTRAALATHEEGK